MLAQQSPAGLGIEGGGEFHYRYTVGLWFRRIWILQPHGEVMINAPLDYQLHALIGMVLFTLWPFTRLVDRSRS
jgi:nitrate reductase gamma subunit